MLLALCCWLFVEGGTNQRPVVLKADIPNEATAKHEQKEQSNPSTSGLPMARAGGTFSTPLTLTLDAPSYPNRPGAMVGCSSSTTLT
jgi:hypothetical protein